jgi:hypothetical protein
MICLLEELSEKNITAGVILFGAAVPKKTSAVLTFMLK